MIVGIGVDVVEIPRLRKTFERHGDRFVRRVFTQAEQEYCRAHADAIPHYAARFAAKEALFKALGTGWARGVTWLDVEVRREAQAAPELGLKGEAEKLSKSLGMRSIHVTLSHSDAVAIAFVVLDG
jgi:holo-[acyl-carrier protein] synthase